MLRRPPPADHPVKNAEPERGQQKRPTALHVEVLFEERNEERHEGERDRQAVPDEPRVVRRLVIVRRTDGYRDRSDEDQQPGDMAIAETRAASNCMARP